MNPSNPPVAGNVLPENFDGTFKFTNFTDTEFKAKWNNVEYTYPPMKTVPMIIANATPLEVQNIRKKFAKELAEREWFKTPKFIGMNTSHLDKAGQPTGGMPAIYTEKELNPFIQRCLEPLPIARATVEVTKSDIEGKISKDNKGRPRTRVLDPNESLVAQASSAIEE